MRRRAFIAGIGGAAFASAFSSVGSHGQTSSIPLIGVLSSGAAGMRRDQFDAFHAGLKEAGYVAGQNLSVEYRGADDQYDRLPELADELVRMRVAVILAAAGPVTALAAQKVTTDVPIVFTGVADPVRSGLVRSMNQPGGNITGAAGLTAELDAKRLEILRELIPSATVGILVNPNRPNVDSQIENLRKAALAAGQRVLVVNAGERNALDTAFAELAQRRAESLVIAADPFFSNHRQKVVELTLRYSLPAIHQWREFALAGGLASYSPSLSEIYRLSGTYVGRILKGEKPADLPVIQPAKFELVINVRTARTLGLTIPPLLLARADEVIE